jgi:hypothetical protein
MHKNATKCNETIYKWCKNKHGASKIIDTFETYQHGKDIACVLAGKASEDMIRMVGKSLRKVSIWAEEGRNAL